MFSYRCPACGKQHQIDSPFEQPFDAPCLRCREVIHVTQELVYGAVVGVGAKGTKLSERIVPAGAPASQFGSGADTNGLTDSDGAEPEAADQGAVNPNGPDSDEPQDKKQSKPKKRKLKKTDVDEEGEVSEAVRKGRRQWLIIAGIAVLVLGLLGGGGYLGYETFRKKQDSASDTATAKTGGQTKVVASAKSSTTSNKGASAKDAKDKTGDKAKEKVAASAKQKAGPATKDKPAPPPTGKAAATGKGKADPAAAKAAAVAKEVIEPIITPRDDKVIRISAVRLATELAQNPKLANETYKAAVLEVSGIFAGQELKATAQRPARPHMIFVTPGPPILADLLGSHTSSLQWAGVRRGEFFTIRGVYSEDGLIHHCDLQPPTPIADAKYKGKDIEVSGIVRTVERPTERINPFPRVTLEGETFSLLQVECYFRTTDTLRVLEFRPEMPVIIRGTCSGRFMGRSDERAFIRIDNCEFLTTSAAANSRIRVDAGQLLRDYEEDLRTVLIPPWGEESQLQQMIPITQLENELITDEKAFQRKYANKNFTIKGVAEPAMLARGQLLLTTGETNAVLKVECRLKPLVVKELGKGPVFSIHGLYLGKLDNKKLVLENCEPFDLMGRRDFRRLTADFLPHVPGQALTYDVHRITAPGGNNRVVRVLIEQKENGLSEAVITHVGVLRSKSLFDASEREGKWAGSKEVKKVRLPDATRHHRMGGGFVSTGMMEPDAKGKGRVIWLPSLMIGAKVGETWKSSEENITNEFTLVKFDKYQGQNSAVILQKASTAADPHHPVEVEHIYVEKVGEVERREVARISSKETRLLTEIRIVGEVRPITDSMPAPKTP
jgi:hypothetical protein